MLLHVRPNYIPSTSNDIHTDGARARAKTGGHKGNQGRQEIQGKRRISNGDKLYQNTKKQMGLGLRLGDMRESGETGDSREEEDIQWRQVIPEY